MENIGYDARLPYGQRTLDVILKLARHQQGLTIRQAARRARVLAADWREWESGFSKGPDIDQCGPIAKALGMTINEFFGC